ncbi:MAG: hypothetical protein ABIA75_04530 [Candidatus Neomarinimicrobiota bacterium]
MGTQVNHFWTNIAVGVLGLFVGIDNLLGWMSDSSLTQELVIGSICTILATTWLVYVFVKRNKES